MKIKEQQVWNHKGFGKSDPRPGSHLIKTTYGDTATPTITAHVEINMCVLEIYEE